MGLYEKKRKGKKIREEKIKNSLKYSGISMIVSLECESFLF